MRKYVALALALIMVLTVAGCNDKNEGRKVGAIEGDASVFGMVSRGSSLTPESGPDGTWEWTWLLESPGSQGNYMGVSIVHLAGSDESEILGKVKTTAGEEFNWQKQSYIDEINKLFPEEPSDVPSAIRDYPRKVNSFVESDLVGFKKQLPDPKIYTGAWEGKIMCLRTPKCIGYVTIRISDHEKWTTNKSQNQYFADVAVMIRNIQILGNQ